MPPLTGDTDLEAAARRAPQPTLHERIRADIESKILSGDWPPGFRIPFEHELMAQYGCARMTVNKVMAGLASAGLIERRRRAGTFVAQPRIQSAVLRIPDIQAEVAGRGETYDYELLACRRRSVTDRDPLMSALTAGAEVLDIRCRHMANGRPFALENRLIALMSVPEAAEVDFAQVAPGSWLLTHVPWTEAEHRITATNATAREAELLGLNKGAACLCVERRTWRGIETITYVRQLFRGDHYDLVARFAPQG
jgi:GntR family transcriptional regulator, histidine utilization repressor